MTLPPTNRMWATLIAVWFRAS